MANAQLMRLLQRALRTRSRAGLASLVVVALVALGTWWLQDGGDAGEPSADPSESVSESASESVSETADATPTPEDSSEPAEPVDGTDPASGLPYVALAALPPEASDTLRLIDAGGPFPYERDGIRFGNFEGILPDEPDGYYAEYTVETPGLDHRGARRIVTGDGGELYWTDDHYESFSVIVR